MLNVLKVMKFLLKKDMSFIFFALYLKKKHVKLSIKLTKMLPITPLLKSKEKMDFKEKPIL